MRIFLLGFVLFTWTVLIQDGSCLPHKSHALEYDVEEDVMHPRLPESKTEARLRTGEDTNDFWLEQSKDFISRQEETTSLLNKKIAKNVILFLGDGMGLTTLAAARNYVGGEETKLSFEEFPYTGFSRTYSVDKIVADSACTSTSYLCGVKANYGTVGVNAHVERDDCEAMRNASNHVFSIAKWAMDAGKAAGLVTTARVTHASPAGVYAHVADREWENDSQLKEFCGSDSGLDDIAVQLIHGEVGSKLKVMLGGGKKMFLDPMHDKKGLRSDGRNLIDEYRSQSNGNAFVETEKELQNIKVDKIERLLGLFKNGHLDYHLDQLANKKNTQPTLEQMTRKAIEVLQREENGYFLFVEGGKIDMGHHYVWTRHALEETSEFSKAIEAALEMTSEDDTLIVTTADHSHTFSVAGYTKRGTDVFSLNNLPSGTDDIPYVPLTYANGPGFAEHYDTEKNKRVKPKKVIKGDADDVFPSTVPLVKETHSGEDVAVFAKGPWAHLFTGVYEQNAIPHMMAYAACIGNGLKACQWK